MNARRISGSSYLDTPAGRQDPPRRRGRRLGSVAADERAMVGEEDRSSPRLRGAMDRIWEGR